MTDSQHFYLLALRDTRTDEWFKLSARKPGGGELRQIFNNENKKGKKKKEEKKKRTPRSRSEKRRAKGTCIAHVVCM